MVGRTLLAILCAALAGCAGAPAPVPASQPVLSPGALLRGAELSPPLQRPIAVAAQGAELYVVDAVLGLARVDPQARRVVPIVRRAFASGTRIAADADGSVYVLEPALRRLQRLARDGRVLTAYEIDATVGSLTDFILDAARGRVLALDALHRQLVAFHPLGRAFEVMPLRGMTSPTAIALGDGALYAADPRCACLARIAPDGRLLATFGHNGVRQPGRLAADRHGRVVIYDHGDRKLKVFRGERLAGEFDLLRLGVTEVSDLALAEGWLTIADAPGAQLRMFRMPAR